MPLWINGAPAAIVLGVQLADSRPTHSLSTVCLEFADAPIHMSTHYQKKKGPAPSGQNDRSGKGKVKASLSSGLAVTVMTHGAFEMARAQPVPADIRSTSLRCCE